MSSGGWRSAERSETPRSKTLDASRNLAFSMEPRLQKRRNRRGSTCLAPGVAGTSATSEVPRLPDRWLLTIFV
jgi:hypothetical protein